ncbi:MAG: tetrathionate reductase family octaheme c-type cytochrome [Thermodesulfobacteriota bacterium]|nr:tetrathionate reductase family octaheme c-type cytochrome [Thermodesulfobacteriota bacterium]
MKWLKTAGDRTCLSPGAFLGLLFLAVVLCLPAISAAETISDGSSKAPGRVMADQATRDNKLWITADHSKHKKLQQVFENGPDVTKACLSCHNEASLQFHKTIHWTWIDPATQDSLHLGKGAMTVNNFCISIHSNEPRCTSCHAGYGWKDKNFDFLDPNRVDCLVCHEQTGTYKKFPAGAGHAVSKPTVFKGNGKSYYPPDWDIVAQSVSRPSRKNCGTCHFYGGGGDGVKHGDLDSSLAMPAKQLDVHMGTDGQNFTCTRCHSTTLHKIAGRVYTTPAAAERKSLIEDDLASKITCESCHSSLPHKAGSKPNDHTDKVACQGCHIPTYARVNPTKVWWDWSKAGRKKDGKPYAEEGPLGKHVYMTKKGEMRWEKNGQPAYFWYNGSIRHLALTDTINPENPVWINQPVGSREDNMSRIFPFKIHKGRQPYDKIEKRFVVPHLFPSAKDDSDAYWKGFEWGPAIKAGMAYAGLPYSGEFDFVETRYVYPITHMVAPKENVVGCRECHISDGGRLANLAGFYMPGRDGFTILNVIGWLVVFGSLAVVMLHALVRMIVHIGGGNNND